MYGTINPGIFHVTGIRHTVTPSISYNYAPKTERNQQYYNFTGTGASSSKRKSMGFALSNLFQMKFKKGESEAKYDLFNINMRTGYNFESKTQKWDKLSTSFTSGALKIVTIDAGASHSFYDEVTGQGRFLDPQLRSFTMNTSFNRNFQLKGLGGSDADSTEQGDTTGVGDGYADKKEKSNPKDFVVNMSVNHSYNESRTLGKKTITRWIGSTFDIDLTAGWHFNYSIHYDIQAKTASSQSLKISRNLHCWQGELAWVPTGSQAGYYFRLYVSLHPDIKIEQSRGGVRGGYY